jgi:competence protein ComFC
LYQNLLKPFYQDAKKFILDTLFPIRCLVCEKDGEFICLSCRAKLTRLLQQHCIFCQKPSLAGLTHPYCQTPHGADGLISIFDYHDENVKNIIIKGKYSFVPEFYKILGSMAAEKLKTNYSNLLKPNTYLSDEAFLTDGALAKLVAKADDLIPILVPIPLSPFRKRWRGFNQAEVLCQVIGGQLDFPVADILKRHKLTKVQKDVKKREDRAKNMSGAFALRSRLPSFLERRYFASEVEQRRGQNDAIDITSFDIHGRNFILVDDVVTTGSTLLEAVKVLKRNGANKVYCLTVARD